MTGKSTKNKKASEKITKLRPSYSFGKSLCTTGIQQVVSNGRPMKVKMKNNYQKILYIVCLASPPPTTLQRKITHKIEKPGANLKI